jgi:hypothetical protein
MTPQQRRLRAQIAANTKWSHPMARADQADAARTAIFARLEREVDPDDALSASERAPLVEAAARRLSATLNSARSRKRTRLRTARNLPGVKPGMEFVRPHLNAEYPDTSPSHAVGVRRAPRISFPRPVPVDRTISTVYQQRSDGDPARRCA